MAGSPVGQQTSPQPIEVKFTIDRDGLTQMETLQRNMGSRNLATALYNAAVILNQLYDYQAKGYESAILKKGEYFQTFALPVSK